ncbi:MFS general substrate transporter [Gymnopilus junonius]|uniref:MFS general substrate transporter n=1 Tax=Gymnopilus junonius TaxID=109634 RepID=A0A9P5TSL7_GYMJU|nr:MFS general substrate transporter [Gymnopilus junonius]
MKEKRKDTTVTNAVRRSKETSADFPDGGLRAWLVVVGAMCNTFASFGYVNTWGIFQNYYETTLLKDSPPSSIAWIGSVQYSLVLLPALFVGRLFDLGYFRSIFMPSSCILVVATFLTAQCTEYWEFLLCQGFLVGLGCGGVFGHTAPVIAHWFKRRRGLAMGWVAMGSSIGGTVLPIIGKNLLPAVGFKWTMRIFGFILMTILVASNLLLKRRLAPRKVAGGLFNIRAFKSAAFTIYCLSGFFTFLGLYTVLTYVVVSATASGISPNFAFYYVAIANASSLFGRYTSGNICDRVGPMNVIIPFTAVAGILTYTWPFAQSMGSLVAVVVIYGFSSGAYIALFSNPVLEMGDTLDVGRRSGMFRSITALGALAGPPISGAINTATGEYKVVGYYAGTAVLVGVGLMCIARHLLLKRILGKI